MEQVCACMQTHCPSSQLICVSLCNENWLDWHSVLEGHGQLSTRVETRGIYLSLLFGDQPTSVPMKFLGVNVAYKYLLNDECCNVVQYLGYEQDFRLRMIKIEIGLKNDHTVRPFILRLSECWSALLCKAVAASFCLLFVPRFSLSSWTGSTICFWVFLLPLVWSESSPFKWDIAINSDHNLSG